jgi:16S rRNA (cytosine1402-N4)-methyltransferase
VQPLAAEFFVIRFHPAVDHKRPERHERRSEHQRRATDRPARDRHHPQQREADKHEEHAVRPADDLHRQRQAAEIFQRHRHAKQHEKGNALGERDVAEKGDWVAHRAADPSESRIPRKRRLRRVFPIDSAAARATTLRIVSEEPTPHRRRPRYAGKYPRRFEEKYKERDPQRHEETIEKVLASGKTPAGTHRPIMVAEILEVLTPQPGEIAVDCTLGYGGHAREILARLLPGGRLLGLDADPIELPKTEARVRALGFGPETFSAHRSNFAGLPKILAAERLTGADLILADLGVSSMQLDDPARGFSLKTEGPLDMRMNPQRGQPAAALLEKIAPRDLATLLAENADEPHAEAFATALAGRRFATTLDLASAIRAAVPRDSAEERDLSIRRVFQALRIAVNDEFAALDTFLRQLPNCLGPGGRVAILSFHSGEDRRVKHAFSSGLREGAYAEIAREVLRPAPSERHANPRSIPAKLRWAQRAG